MTEKRFTIEKKYWKTLPQGDYLKDNLTGEKEFGLERFCEIANELHEENKALRMSPRIDVDELESLVCENEKLNNENEELLQFKYKVYRVITERIDLLESDYNKAVKAGMPSNSVYGEIELLEELKEELGK